MTERHRLDGGKGFIIKLMFDDSLPPNDVKHSWSEMTYDGQPGSYVPSIPSHWHEHHNEHIQVLEGRVHFTLSGRDIVLSGGDEPIFIPRRTVHSLHFVEGEASVLREYSDPAGTYKQEFFADLLRYGAMTELPFLEAMRVFYDGDTYVALPGNLRILDRLFMWTVGYLASWLVPAKSFFIDSEGYIVKEEKKVN